MKESNNQKEQPIKKVSEKKKNEPVKNDKKNEKQGLTKEDLPDSTNTSTGQVGSGLRQDSN